MMRINYKKYFYLSLFVLFGGIIVYFGTSFALFKKTDKLTNINFVAGELNYKITNSGLSNNSITVGAGNTHTLTLTLTSLNSVASKYELYYLLDDKKVASDSVIIGYASGSDAVKGTINANATKSISIKIKNVSSKSVKITFGCEGGLSANNLTLSKGLSLDRLITDGDIEMYYTYVGDRTAPSKFPYKGDGYIVKSVTCNGANAQWSNATWTFSFSNITKEKMLCSFVIDDSDYITDEIIYHVKKNSPSDIRIDTHAATGNQNYATTEYRYYGTSPNNYIQFNGETWRIIGVFNVDDGTGNIQRRLKIIRDGSIDNLSWDSTSSTAANKGYGLNVWSQSKLYRALLYTYAGSSNSTCYTGANEAYKTCYFSTIGLSADAKSMIGNATWYLGAHTSSSVSIDNMYNYERGSASGRQCDSNSDYCWGGSEKFKFVATYGLMYPSDYGYSGNKSSCSSFSSTCGGTSWLTNGTNQWTITPYANSSNSYYAYYIKNNTLSSTGVYNAYSVRPVVYLLEDIKFTGGTGASNNMYKISK